MKITLICLNTQKKLYFPLDSPQSPRTLLEDLKSLNFLKPSSSFLKSFFCDENSSQASSDVMNNSDLRELQPEALNYFYDYLEEFPGEYEVIISDDITSITPRSFKSLESIVSVKLPSSLTHLSEGVFEDCCNLENIVLPEGLLSIADKAFKDCTEIKFLEFPLTLTEVGESAFEGCSSCEFINLPEGLLSIADKAFKDCTEIKFLEFPSTLIELGESAFEGCSSCEFINLPEGLSSLKDKTFSGCCALSSIKIPQSVFTIGQKVFLNCMKIQEINIPENVESIGNSAFQGCLQLASVQLPNSVQSLGEKAFMGCLSLNSILISNQIRCLQKNTFFNCISLKSQNIPKNVELIENQVFAHCKNLVHISLSDQAKISNDCFKGCLSLSSITGLENPNEPIFDNQSLLEFASKNNYHLLALYTLKEYENKIDLLFLTQELMKTNEIDSQQQRGRNMSLDSDSDLSLESEQNIENRQDFESQQNNDSNQLIDTNSALKAFINKNEVFTALINSTNKYLMKFVVFKIQDFSFFENLISRHQIKGHTLTKIVDLLKKLMQVTVKDLGFKFQKSSLRTPRQLSTPTVQHILDFIPVKDRGNILTITKNLSVNHDTEKKSVVISQ